MPQLLCEGPCNHHLTEAIGNDLYRAYMSRFTKQKTDLLTPIAALRRLRYTEHVEARPGRYACMDCGTERRW